MSRWKPWDLDWDRFDAAPKRPPPKRGIKMKQAGATWWGKRWIDALERMSSGYSSRLSRGKTYARAGRAHDLDVGAGKVTAKVTGSREPYDVQIRLTPLRDEVWSKAIAALAAKAQFTAELLDGRMPDAIDDVFKQAGRSLFPVRATDLRTECTCPDWANPCKHVAAVHFVLGEAFDRDPFLLFELRGRTKEQVLDALRVARGGAAVEPASEPGRKRARGRRAASVDASRDEAAVESEIATVQLGRIAAKDYDAPPNSLPSLRFHFEAPPVPGALLRQLGSPSGWSDARPAAERLAPIVLAAAETARRIALESAGNAGDDVEQPSREPVVVEPQPGGRSRRQRKPRRIKNP